MSQRMVTVRSGVVGTVSVVYPQYGLNRKWNKMGQPMQIPFDTIQQCLWENGFDRMIRSGVLYIDDMQDKKDLGLEPADAETPVNIIVFSEKDMEMLLKNMPFDIFKKRVLEAPRLQVDNLIDYAIEHEIVDVQKADFLKKLTTTENGAAGRDILKAISSKKEDEEAERREAARQEARARDRE